MKHFTAFGYSLASTLLGRLFVATLIGTAVLGASAQTLGGYNVAAPEARRVINIEEGVLLDILPLEIEKAASNEARTAGGVIGGLIGAAVGSSGNGGWGRASALGALGALAGDAVARRSGEEKSAGLQLVVRLSSGRTIAVAQESIGEPLRPGDSVYVMHGQTTRVVRSNKVASNDRPVDMPSRPTATSHSDRPWPAPEQVIGYQNAVAYGYR